MKSFLLILGSLAFLAVIGWDSTGVVDSFTAQPDGDGITLNWHSEIETGITGYSVQRADISSTNDFETVGSVAATGNYSYYKFHDANVSSAPLAGQSGNLKALSNAYKYRLQINLSSGDISYSQTVSVTSPSSGVRRTWGMIKEMFH